MKQFLRQSASRVILPLTYIDKILRPGIRILMYHRVENSSNYDQLTVSPEVFDRQMNYLSKNYNVVSLDSAIKALYRDKNNLNNVVITFDDGYRDNLENALPILNKYQLSATIFVTTEFCDQIMSHPRYRNEQKRLHLDWDEVNKLNGFENISIGSHTLTHPYLSRLENSISEKEITKSKEIIEDKLNSRVKYFCYPSGDFSSREVEYLKKAEYEAAVTVCPGKNRHTISQFEIHRTEVTQKDTETDLFLKLNGAFDLMHRILHWKRTREFKKMSFKNIGK